MERVGRKHVFILAVVILIVALSIYTTFFRDSAPYYIACDQPPRVGPNAQLSYDLGSPHPFADELLWIHVWDYGIQENGRLKVPPHNYLFDLKKKAVIGEVKNGYPLLRRSNGLSILGVQVTFFGPPSEFRRTMDDLWGAAGFTSVTPPEETVSFWRISGEGKGSARISDQYDVYGYGWGWDSSSPDTRYFCMCMDKVFYLLDCEKNTIQPLPSSTWGQGGWWSNTEFLYQNRNGDILLFNTETGTEEVMVSSLRMYTFYHENDLFISDPKLFSIIDVWNGEGYDFLLASNMRSENAKERWLARLDKTTREPVLVDRDFPFYRLGHWNQNAGLYVFSTDLEASAGNAVSIMNTQTKEVKTLIPPGPKQKRYSVPHFHGDRIIFIEDNTTLWSMDTEGGNQEKLFPK